MDAKSTTRFSESLARCMADPGFLDRFYERFTSSSPEIAEKFKDTDFVRQKKALSSSLYLTVMAIEGGEGATTFLEGVAKRHAYSTLAGTVVGSRSGQGPREPAASVARAEA